MTAVTRSRPVLPGCASSSTVQSKSPGRFGDTLRVTQCEEGVAGIQPGLPGTVG